MRINIITLLIAFGIAALIGYAFYVANDAEMDIPLANALGGGFTLFVTLAGAISIRAKDSRASTMNLRVASFVFFAVLLIEQIIFTFVSFSLAPYIIATGILLLVYVLIAYAIGKSM